MIAYSYIHNYSSQSIVRNHASLWREILGMGYVVMLANKSPYRRSHIAARILQSCLTVYIALPTESGEEILSHYSV